LRIGKRKRAIPRGGAEYRGRGNCSVIAADVGCSEKYSGVMRGAAQLDELCAELRHYLLGLSGNFVGRWDSGICVRVAHHSGVNALQRGAAFGCRDCLL
jgi:hypothetical protein